MPRHYRRSLIALLAAVPLLVSIGCSDDDDCPGCPGSPADPPLNMQTAWPSADGNAWIHDLEFRGFDGDPSELLEPDDPLPELPTMEELHARLAEPVPYDPRDSSEGLYRMRFDGDVTTESDVTAQHLREELFTPIAGTVPIPSQPERLRALVLAMRPDLRSDGAGKDVGEELAAPILMGGYAFETTDAGIYGYGDVNQDHSWIYLEGDLEVGDAFSIQLVPDLADGVYLYGRIWSVGDREVADRTYSECVECFYVIDFGESVVTDEQGNQIGRMRGYLYGSVLYAPGVGPVSCHQRFHSMAEPLIEPVILEYVAAISGTDVELP